MRPGEVERKPRTSREILDEPHGRGPLRSRRYLGTGGMGGSHSRDSQMDEAYNTEGYYGNEYVRETDYDRADLSQYGYGYNSGYLPSRRGVESWVDFGDLADEGSLIGWRTGYVNREYGLDYGPNLERGRQAWRRPGPYTGLGPKGFQRSAERIREEVCERMTQHGLLDARQIRVQVQDREVILEGTVCSRIEKKYAEWTAESVAGVEDVHNRLKIEI